VCGSRQGGCCDEEADKGSDSHNDGEDGPATQLLALVVEGEKTNRRMGERENYIVLGKAISFSEGYIVLPFSHSPVRFLPFSYPRA
jgi:hypothetical protein